MDSLLTFSSLQHFILIKLCLFIFIFGGVIFIYRKWKPIYFLLFFGLCCAGAYYFLVQGTGLMFWGIEGDEVTIAAMYEMFAHGPLWADFAYTGLPPFYPPLFFWLFGLVGRVFALNGVQLAKLGAEVTILFFPALLYLIQKYYYKYYKNREGLDGSTPFVRQLADQGKPGKIAWLLSPLLLFALLDWDAIILKPYEVISAMLIILWGVFLLNELKVGLDKKKIIWFGISGGVLFLLFYFWFFLVAIGITLFNLFSKIRVTKKQYFSLFLIGLIVLVCASPFWLPLALSYRQSGAENWQLGFFTIEWLNTPNFWLEGIVRGAIGMIGFGALIIWRRQLYVRSLLCFFVSAFVWQLMGFLTIYFFSSPLQETKGFYFFNRALIALSAAYALEQIYLWAHKKELWRPHLRSVVIISLFLISTRLIFGSFVEQANIQAVRTRALVLEKAKKELVEYLKKDEINFSQSTVVHSGANWLHAFLPFNEFVYFNQHNSHPAANFSERFYYLKDLAQVKTSKEFYDKIKSTPFGAIDWLIFYTGDKEYYPLYFHLDNFPNQFKEVIVNIPRRLVTEEFFTKKFSNRDYVVFEPNK